MTTDTRTLKRDVINAFFAAEYDEYETCDLEEDTEELFEYDGMRYLILTDEEADETARENISETLWAFNTQFLASHMPCTCPMTMEGEKAFIASLMHMQEQCESCNDAMRALLGENFDHFVNDAILSDGRGHFISQYDGEETEFEYEGVMYYIYKNN